MSYGLFGAILAAPGKRDELVGYLLQASQLLEQDPRCIHYVIGTSEHPDAVWISEVWTDQAAHDASLESDDIRQLIGQAQPLIAGMSDQTELTIHGGKGVPGDAS
jgi:quinol monooxygenase YgiN